MPANNRSAGRNVFLYSSQNPSEIAGGFVLTRGFTNTSLYSVVENLFCFTTNFDIRQEGGGILAKDNTALHQGNFFVHSDGVITLTPERGLTRAHSGISSKATPRLKAFSDAVRKRDMGCAISGLSVSDDDWEGLEAAHIWPIAYAGDWNAQQLDKHITIPAEGSNINSVQNGILLRTDIHHVFDSYNFSIDTKDNYKIVCFRRDHRDIAGKHLASQFLNDSRRPPDWLLDWHFKQAVLTTVKGVGEPMFEFDFPAGSDMIGQILRGPKPNERMEFELFSRLALYQVDEV